MGCLDDILLVAILDNLQQISKEFADDGGNKRGQASRPVIGAEI